MGIKFKVDESFFSTWDKTMSYVLGYIYADGSLEDAFYLRGKYIRVSSVDLDMLIKIKMWLKSEHKIIKVTHQKKGKQGYLLRIGNQKLYDSLTKYGLYPNKSLTIKFPPVPDKFLSDFIRGYFDGDGCVYIDKKRNSDGKMLIKRLSIIFTSGSRNFLEKLGLVLKNKLLLPRVPLYKNGQSFQLRYSTDDSIKIFYLMYSECSNNVYMERKKTIFKDYFSRKPNRISVPMEKLLKTL